MADDTMRPFLVKCPACKKETAWEGNPFRPFCSERCRIVDLGKWAADEYRIPDVGSPPDGEDAHNKKRTEH